MTTKLTLRDLLYDEMRHDGGWHTAERAAMYAGAKVTTVKSSLDRMVDDGLMEKRTLPVAHDRGTYSCSTIRYRAEWRAADHMDQEDPDE